LAIEYSRIIAKQTSAFQCFNPKVVVRIFPSENSATNLRIPNCSSSCLPNTRAYGSEDVEQSFSNLATRDNGFWESHHPYSTPKVGVSEIETLRLAQSQMEQSSSESF